MRCLAPLPRLGRPLGPSRFLPLTLSLVLAMTLLAGSASGSGAQSGVGRPLPNPPSIEGAETVAPRGRLAGFYRRRAAGRGTFLTAADLERRRSARLSDILRTVPGVSLVALDGMGMAIASSRPGWHPGIGRNGHERGACFLDLLLDGVRLTPSPGVLPVNIDDIAPARLAAIEIHRATSVPIELQVGAGSCGVIAMWSREP